MDYFASFVVQFVKECAVQVLCKPSRNALALRRFALRENSKEVRAQPNGARCYSVYLEFCSVSCKANAKRARHRCTWTNSDWRKRGREIVGGVSSVFRELEIQVRSFVRRYRADISLAISSHRSPSIPPSGGFPSRATLEITGGRNE